MARVTQINIDGSRLQGVDLSQVSNEKLALPKVLPKRLDIFSSNIAKAAISAAADVSDAGQWATIPQDFGSGLLTATMVVPTPTPTPGPTPGPLIRRPTTVAVTIGVTAVLVIGGNVDGGFYWEAISNDFGLVGALSPTGSSSIGVTGAVDILFVAGPISLLDGPGLTIIVDIGISKTMFTGGGVLITLPSWDVVGYVFEVGGGPSFGPPITINIQLGYTAHKRITTL